MPPACTVGAPDKAAPTTMNIRAQSSILEDQMQSSGAACVQGVRCVMRCGVSWNLLNSFDRLPHLLPGIEPLPTMGVIDPALAIGVAGIYATYLMQVRPCVRDLRLSQAPLH